MIVLDAPVVPFPGDPDPKMKTGNSFFFTINPRDGVDNAPRDIADTLIAKILGDSFYHVLVREKEGLRSHYHFVIFMRTRIVDQSNYKRSYGQARKSPLHYMYEDSPVPKDSEWHNFMHNGCVKQPYNTDIITEYLSGHFEAKADDPFEMLSAHLPSDLDHLSPWLSDPALLGRSKPVLNAWYVQYEKLFIEDHPGFDHLIGVSESYLSQWYNIGVYCQRRFPIIVPTRKWKEQIKNLQRFINQYAGPGYGSHDTALKLDTPAWPQLVDPVSRKKSDKCPGSFEDEDRDYFCDNMTSAERLSHDRLCTGVS